MRQAGRFMPSYRSLREKYSFEEICSNVDLIVHTTLLPVKAFDIDAMILFSDILLPLAALGVVVSFPEGGPRLLVPKALEFPDNFVTSLEGQLHSVYAAAVELSSLDRPLIGFAGAPWTLAVYLLEQGVSSEYQNVTAALRDPSHGLLHLIVALEDLIVAHLNLQIRAGCEAVQLFDSFSHLVPVSHHLLYSYLPLQRILARLEKRKDGTPCPLIYYKALPEMLASLSKISPAGLSLSDTTDLSTIRSVVPKTIAIQGNLSPNILKKSKSELIAATCHMCSFLRNDPGFIANLGGGVPKDASEDSVRLFVETVRNERPS